MRSNKTILLAGIAVPVLFLASPAIAQTETSTQPETQTSVNEASPYGDDIVVSARKRDESMSTVPISIACLPSI